MPDESQEQPGQRKWPNAPARPGFHRGFRGIAWWHSLWVMALLGVLARFNKAVLNGPDVVTAMLIGAAIALAVATLLRALFRSLAAVWVWALAGAAFVATLIVAALI